MTKAQQYRKKQAKHQILTLCLENGITPDELRNLAPKLLPQKKRQASDSQYPARGIYAD